MKKGETKSREGNKVKSKVLEIAPRMTGVRTSKTSGKDASNTKRRVVGSSDLGYPIFPCRLHNMLDAAEDFGFTDVVHWLPDGTGFVIVQPKKMTDLIQKYFNQNKFKSFLRQLQNYGFHRVLKGPEAGYCRHPLFIKGRMDLIKTIQRKPKMATAATATLSPPTKSKTKATSTSKIKPRKEELAPMPPKQKQDTRRLQEDTYLNMKTNVATETSSLQNTLGKTILHPTDVTKAMLSVPSYQLFLLAEVCDLHSPLPTGKVPTRAGIPVANIGNAILTTSSSTTIASRKDSR